MTLLVPKLWRISAQQAWFTPDPNCTLLQIRLVGPGGGGSGTTTSADVPDELAGLRGEDTIFHLRPPMQGRFACPPLPDSLHVYTSNDPGFEPGQAIVLPSIPDGYTGIEAWKPYYPINVTQNPTNWSFQLSATPYSPPIGLQVPISVAPFFTNPSLWFHKTWYGAQGGGSGRRIGDQGTPGSYWGLDGIGPDGEVQSEGLQGGCGNGMFRMGPGGGVGPLGGNSGWSYQDNAINGTNMTGAGGGGAPPPVGYPDHFGGCSGASGSWGEIWMKPTGSPIYCFAGKKGLGGPAGLDGFKGGDGGHGSLRIWQWREAA